VSKHVAVCREVQTDFRRFFRANFIKKIWGHFLDLCVQNKNCLLLSSDAFWKFSACKFCRKSSWRNFTIYASKNVIVCCKFRRISEVLLLHGLQKKLWVEFHNLCVQKRSCLLLSSDAFRKFSPCKLYKKFQCRIFTLFVSKNKAVAVKLKLRRILEVLRPHGLQRKFWTIFHNLCIPKS